MADYSKTDKFLHRFYLSNYGLSRATLEMEQIIHGSRAKQWDIEQCVFVTGLARSGTTAVMRKLYESGSYASLQYSNMPFILCPNLWNRKADLQAHERAHNDGIIIDGNSPEEFDEYFWKAFLNDGYITDQGMQVHEVEPAVLETYNQYIRLICLAKGKHRYISKNNNNILRLKAISSVENSRLIMLFREPLAHAASLRKLHLKFSEVHREDHFALEYFNFLGHHEFGLNHKPFLLNDTAGEFKETFDYNSIDYWLSVWLNYYEYVIKHLEETDILISFEDLINNPIQVYKMLWRELHINSPLQSSEKHNPTSYPELNCRQELLKRCNEVYQLLLTI